VYLDGQPVMARTPLTREGLPIDLRLPPAARFLTIAVTDQNRDIGYDQVFLADPVLARLDRPAEGLWTDADEQELARAAREFDALPMPTSAQSDVAAQVRSATLDAASLSGPVFASAYRAGAPAIHARAWSAHADRTKPPDLRLTLSELPDPGNEATYLLVSDPARIVEDELCRAPAHP
jgi:hypothetical protein